MLAEHVNQLMQRKDGYDLFPEGTSGEGARQGDCDEGPGRAVCCDPNQDCGQPLGFREQQDLNSSLTVTPGGTEVTCHPIHFVGKD